MTNRELWIYDIETLASCFTYTAINIDTLEIVKYVIHKDRNDLEQLIIHLNQCKGQIGFNNINFDYPVIHEVLIWNPEYPLKAKYIIEMLYNKAQQLISSQSIFGSGIKEKEILIPQLDLFKIWHFNNPARSTSLKSLEISMNYPNVMDMPIHHNRTDIQLEEIDGILEYNLNDVLATFEFYKLSKDKINLRLDLNKKYNLNCVNYPDSKIGESLVLKLYCEQTNQNIWDVKQLRTKRESIKLSDCIFNYIEFHSKEFNSLLNKLKSKTIVETKGSITESVIYKGFKYDYGTGGIKYVSSSLVILR